MKKNNNKSGFTLIEIIVVLIIVGILAAIALPNLFQNVTRSQASAALASVDGYKTSIEACAVKNNQTAGTAPCDMANIGLPSNVSNFTIAIAAASGTPSGANLAYQITGTDGGQAVQDVPFISISITRHEWELRA
jgi:type IV pilus assembly protein PilA